MWITKRSALPFSLEFYALACNTAFATDTERNALKEDKPTADTLPVSSGLLLMGINHRYLGAFFHIYSCCDGFSPFFLPLQIAR